MQSPADLATVIETLDLKNAVLVGFSTGGGEVARYIGRHGTSRVSKAVLVSAVPPIMVRMPTRRVIIIGSRSGKTHILSPADSQGAKPK